LPALESAPRWSFGTFVRIKSQIGRNSGSTASRKRAQAVMGVELLRDVAQRVDRFAQHVVGTVDRGLGGAGIACPLLCRAQRCAFPASLDA